MDYKAQLIAAQGNHELALDMTKRCVAYYETLGQNWLGTARRVSALFGIAGAVGHIDGWAAAEPLFVEAKRTAQKELGKKHAVTLSVTWGVCLSTCLL